MAVAAANAQRQEQKIVKHPGKKESTWKFCLGDGEVVKKASIL